jgi:hypothetical protein
MAEENGISVILLTPFIRRLHLQRGLFVETRKTLSKEDLKIVEVRFPYQSSKRSWGVGSFEVFREGGAVVDIFPQQKPRGRNKVLSHWRGDRIGGCAFQECRLFVTS